MSNENSIISNYYDEDSVSTKTNHHKNKFIAKRECKSQSRPQSTQNLKKPEILEKKLENLEKKQVLWKERSHVWGKEKKNYEKALFNAYKDPNEYYKNLINNWHASQIKAKFDNESFGGKIEQLRGFLKWVIDQSGETPLKYIKDLAKEQFIYLEDIESKYLKYKVQFETEKNKVIEGLKLENYKLAEKMSLGVQDVINSLQKKLFEFANNEASLTKNLDSAKVLYTKEEINLLNQKISQMNQSLLIKDQEILEYTSSNSILQDHIQDLKQQIEEKKLINFLPLQEISENTEKVLQKLMIQVKDLEEENFRIQKVNEIYEYEIKSLQKTQALLEQSKSKVNLKFNDQFNMKTICTQTLLEDNKAYNPDWIQISNCLAAALEEVLISNTEHAQGRSGNYL